MHNNKCSHATARVQINTNAMKQSKGPVSHQQWCCCRRLAKVLLSSTSPYLCQALLLVVVPYSTLTTTYDTVEWRRPPP